MSLEQVLRDYGEGVLTAEEAFKKVLDVLVANQYTLEFDVTRKFLTGDYKDADGDYQRVVIPVP